MAARTPAKTLAMVIPCYNESASIAAVINRFPRQELQRHGITLKIYVIDNNSTDNTAAIAKEAGATVFHERQKGKGNALRTGFRRLPKHIDYVAMLDGDNTYDPAEILRMIEPLRSDFCDVVIGSRLGGRIETAAMNRLNRLGNTLFTAMVRKLYGANVTDVLTGYFAWKKAALDELVPHITSAGFAIEMEMITKMARLGHQMTSVPISYDPRAGESHLRPLTDGSRILGMLLRNLGWRTMTMAGNAAKSQPARSRGRKIVFVSDAVYPYMKGGKEKRLYEITRRLAAMGHDVHVYTMHWWQEPHRVQVEDGVQLHAICKRYQMYQGDRRSIKQGLMFGLACLKLFRVRFDILDVDHMPFFPIFSTWLVCILRRRKLHATWHEALSRKEWVSYMGAGGLVAALIERICVHLPHYITAASAHTRELLRTHHGRTKGVSLVASGIDTSLLRDIEPAATPCDVLYVGRLVKDKHVDMLIRAMAVVRQRQANVRCVIVGDGPEKKHLQKLAARQRVDDIIAFQKPLPEATDVYALMKAAKVFCSPSVREGFGITALEALACGTPVITTNSPANAARHLVQDSQTGSIVPPDAACIAQALEQWITVGQKPDTAEPTKHYDWRLLAQKQAEVYTQ